MIIITEWRRSNSERCRNS